MDEDTLRQLNDAYVAARLRTQDAKARRDKIAAARAGGSDAALSGIDSTVLSRLKIERALAARTVGELGQDLGPNHPRMVAARADLVRAESQIEGELKTLSLSADAEYQVAVAAEAAARKSLDDAGAVVTDTGERTIELRELENEASLRADMYKTYVARTEEITLQANTQVSDARVIAPANVPLSPFAPRQTLILALSGIAGLGLALTIAVYRGQPLSAGISRRRRSGLRAPRGSRYDPCSGRRGSDGRGRPPHDAAPRGGAPGASAKHRDGRKLGNAFGVG